MKLLRLAHFFSNQISFACCKINRSVELAALIIHILKVVLSGVKEQAAGGGAESPAPIRVEVEQGEAQTSHHARAEVEEHGT